MKDKYNISFHNTIFHIYIYNKYKKVKILRYKIFYKIKYDLI